MLLLVSAAHAQKVVARTESCVVADPTNTPLNVIGAVGIHWPTLAQSEPTRMASAESFDGFLVRDIAAIAPTSLIEPVGHFG
jgi:hypothetical protein